MRIRAAALALSLFLALDRHALAAWPPGGTEVGVTPIQLAPVMIEDGQGGAFLAWQTGDLYDDIRFTHYTSRGEPANGWPAGGIALGTYFWQPRPRLISDGRSGTLVAWNESGMPPFIGWFRLRHYLGNGRPAPGWPDSPVGLSFPGDTRDSDPLFLSDGRGGVIVVVPSRKNLVIYEPPIAVQRIDERGGFPWGGEWRYLSPESRAPLTTCAAEDGSGGVFVAWSEGIPASAQLYLQRIDESGVVARGWPTRGIPIGAGDVTRLQPAMLPDGHGGALIAWPASGAMRAIRILGDGTIAPGWSAEGAVIFRTTGSGLRLCSDGDAGVIAAWQDSRPRSHGSDVRAQRIDANGVVRWLADGVPICVMAGSQVQVSLSPDRRGGAFLAWSDGRLGELRFAIYASHVLGSGEIARGYPAGGTPVGDGVQQFGSVIVFDPGGAPLVAWQDRPDFESNPRVLLTQLEAPRPGPVVETPRRLSRVKFGLSATPYVRFEADRAGLARVEVFDVGGRRVGASQAMWVEPGERSANPDVPRNLRPGVYLVRIFLGERVTTTRVALLK